MWISSYGDSNVGSKRTNNEDYFLVDDNVGLYLVCDGVGGHEHGEVASMEAATRAADYVNENRKILDEFEDTAAGREALRSLVKGAVQAGNKRVWELAHGQSGRGRMGSTMTLVVVVGDKGAMGHVGDSRLYVQRGTEVHQLSEDHTYLQELVKKGELRPEEVEGHPFGNVITRVLGQHEVVRVDTLVFDIIPKDTYLLCSDGLSEYFPNHAELIGYLGTKEPERITERLIGEANKRGGKDNITAVILRAESGDDDADDKTLEMERTDEITLQFTTLKYVAVFQYLNHKELVQIQQASDTILLREGETAIKEGDSGDSLYVIVDGKLEVSRGGSRVTFLDGGTHFGEMALLNARPRSATVTAVEESRLLKISRDRFNDLVRREPTLGVKLLWSFAQVLGIRLDQTNDQLYGSSGPTSAEIEPPFSG